MNSAPPTTVLIDNETGEPPILGTGDRLIVMGEPKEQRVGPPRQLCEVRRQAPVEDAEMACYDAIESLRGRIEVAGLGNPASGESVGTPRLRAQRLRQAARLVLIAVNDLAHAVERPTSR